MSSLLANCKLFFAIVFMTMASETPPFLHGADAGYKSQDLVQSVGCTRPSDCHSNACTAYAATRGRKRSYKVKMKISETGYISLSVKLKFGLKNLPNLSFLD